MALTRLPGSKWWIETNDVTFEIVGTLLNGEKRAVYEERNGWLKIS